MRTAISLSIAKLALWVTRSKRLKYLDYLEHIQWKSVFEIKRLQFQKLKQLLNHVYRNVPYYRDTFSRLDLNPDEIDSTGAISKLPLLSKNEISKYFKRFFALNYKKSNFFPDSTSGSTGINFQFFKDKTKSDFSNAVTLRHTRWAGWDIGDRQVHLWGSHYDISKRQSYYGKLKNLFIHRTLLLSSYDLTNENMLQYMRKINKYRPKIIIGYASALYLFSKFLEDNNLNICKPKGIISSAETLDEYQRKVIEKVFGCKVFNRYGCREFGHIAQECIESCGLHISAERLIVEVIDENGNPCPSGKLGEIVITDLDNYAFPFIRYKIGDLGILTGRQCPCGRGLPLLEKVEGRIFDIIVGSNGNHLTGTFWTILLREYVKGIKQFKILQYRMGEIIIKLVVDNRFNDLERQKLLKRVYAKCGEEMDVKIQLEKTIPLTESGKHRFIISKVSPYV